MYDLTCSATSLQQVYGFLSISLHCSIALDVTRIITITSKTMANLWNKIGRCIFIWYYIIRNTVQRHSVW